jgi:hypothetical protein
MSFTGADDLLGAWRLESAVEVFDDGERYDRGAVTVGNEAPAWPWSASRTATTTHR